MIVGSIPRSRNNLDIVCPIGQDDQVVAGEQLRAPDDDQDQSEAEDDTGEHLRHAPGRGLGARERHGREDAAEGDEGTGEHGEGEQGESIHRRLLDADLLGALRHLRREQCVEPRMRIETADARSKWIRHYAPLSVQRGSVVPDRGMVPGRR